MSQSTRRWLLVAFVALLAIGAILLTVLALDHVGTRTNTRDVAPVPTLTQPADSTPTPSPTQTSESTVLHERPLERFLAASAGLLWRGTAGECGSIEPLLERSTDGGETWTDVTPRYLGIGQLIALAPFAEGQAEIIALVGPDCETQALRTFTQGQFWESYPDLLAASRYVDPADPGRILAPNSSEPAPCADTRSLHAEGAAPAIVCDGTAYVLDLDTEWRALPASEVVALDVDGDDIVVAHVSNRCERLTLTRYALTDGPAQEAGCASAADPPAPTSIAVSVDEVVVWTGEDVSTVIQ